MHPIRLSANQPAARFYRGGDRIASFRRDLPAAPHTPEDWVASTTSVRGSSPTGLTTLPTGRLLVDEISHDPRSWLGDDHVDCWGADPALLVKLLDAGQRLPVHAHPASDFAARHLGEAHGKAEAWYILTPGTVHVGLRESITHAALRELVEAQRTAELLGMLHPIDVAAGDTVYVPPGLLHSIGEGILLVEVQEPTDLSILLEWDGFDLDGGDAATLALGFEIALQAVDVQGWTAQAIDELVVRRAASGPVLAAGAERYFRLDLIGDGSVVPAGFSVIVGIDGVLEGRAANSTLAIGRGTTIVVPAVTGDVAITGAGRALVARPPVP